MMNLKYTFMPALLLASFSGTIAHSETLQTQINQDIETTSEAALNARFTEVLINLSTLDSEALKKRFDVRNHKGESIFHSAEQSATPSPGDKPWATLDPTQDKVEGTSTEEVYKNFQISADQNEVVVAVIDDGVDITHEDLKGHIWINLVEFSGKPGVDDDNDGYVDDIYGWNFLGNKNGQNVNGTTLELTRIYTQLKAKQAGHQGLTPDETVLFQQVSNEFQSGLKDAQDSLVQYQTFAAAIQLLKQNGLKDETVAGLSAVTSTSPAILKARQICQMLFAQNFGSVKINEGIAHFKTAVDFNYNVSFSSSDIVKDNPSLLNEKGYGNNNVTGPDAAHGTHVSGIIAANRDNLIGIQGQGRNIKIMPIRAVPNGDERDKDVANAIRFAVDHGARVINMSFGKAYSPNKSYVDAAVTYAESKGVLMVHAAGNDGKNTDSQANNFPNRKVKDASGKPRQVETWIEVGASSKQKGANLPASFSNYGKNSVDVFAPGVGILSTVPGNQYASYDGTSMASPETAGVAALLLERFPKATPQQVKKAILNSTNQYKGLTCQLPSSGDGLASTILFSELSISGGTVNAYQAMLEMQKY